jgi:aspartyl-tRNA synthetase
VLARADTLPFSIDGAGYDINEETRLRYRYLDLRRERLRKNLMRSHALRNAMRTFLTDRDFIEVETPLLTKSTPEGARDYVVPSRLHPGMFYALPQSPQQYKQLLMVAGLERYFQIARCFRDEDTRGDRQPEFTQLDIEMSFVTQDDILTLVEEMFVRVVKDVAPEKTITRIPFPRLSYVEAMERYGTDRPDLRENRDDPNELAFAFVVDFPMFEWKETEKRWDAVHHPFTKARIPPSSSQSDEEAIAYLRSNPAEIRAEQYDIVCNGYELGGGSIREHNPRLLQAVFEVMGHSAEEVREKFGHLLTAFSYGVPPHGGIAIGIDRFAMILTGEPNIREVIAFPKTGDGRDPMMGAPAPLDERQLAELHLKIIGGKGRI